MGEACSMNERKERCIQDFGGGNLGERDHLEDQGVDGSIILRWYFRKWDWAWIGLIWLNSLRASYKFSTGKKERRRRKRMKNVTTFLRCKYSSINTSSSFSQTSTLCVRLNEPRLFQTINMCFISSVLLRYMCVCVYVCMYVCMYVYVCIYVCMYVRTYVCMYVCM